MNEARKTAIVTGGSSGIGKATAAALLKKGVKVYEISRREVHAEGITHIGADITNTHEISSAIDRVIKEEGRIDILVNCAGMGISGAIEFTDMEDSKRQIDVNFFGLVNVTKQVLPVMRKQKNGRIVNISSVAAPIPIPFQAFYSASKAAINSYTCALAGEVSPYGISVTAVQPGDIASGFTDARKKEIAGDDEYGGRISRSVAVMEHDETSGMKPEIAGAYIAKIALKNKVKPLYAIGMKYKAFCVLMKLLPVGISNKMIAMIYAK